MFGQIIFNSINIIQTYEVNIESLKDIYNSKAVGIIPQNAYLNLIFCLIRNEYYTEAIESIDEFRETTTSINKYKFILDNYAIEAYLKLGEFEKFRNIQKFVNKF